MERTIKIPEGYEMKKIDDNNYEIVKIEKSADEKLKEVQNKIENWNEEKEYIHFLDAYGKRYNKASDFSYNHAPENIIKAEIILMTLRRLALMWNEGQKGKYYIYQSSDGSLKTVNIGCDYVDYTEPLFLTRELAKKAIEEIGKENLIFMFQNLQKL